jgi:hypothetical protein
MVQGMGAPRTPQELNAKPEEGMVFARLWQALLAVTLESQWISALL